MTTIIISEDGGEVKPYSVYIGASLYNLPSPTALEEASRVKIHHDVATRPEVQDLRAEMRDQGRKLVGEEGDYAVYE